MRLLSAAGSPKETWWSRRECRNCSLGRGSALWRRVPPNEGLQSLRMGDQPSLFRLVSDDPVRRRRRPFLSRAWARGRPVFFDQDDDRADLLAGCDDRRYDAADHRPDRKETAGNTLPLLPEERNQAGRIHDLRQRFG